jgi:hypothetical protein
MGTSGTAQGDPSGLKLKIRGAAAVKPTEVAMDQIAGRKKSKFWFYAVEPAPGTLSSNGDLINGPGPSVINDNGESHSVVGSDQGDTHGDHENGMDNRRNTHSSTPSLDSV